MSEWSEKQHISLLFLLQWNIQGSPFERWLCHHVSRAGLRSAFKCLETHGRDESCNVSISWRRCHPQIQECKGTLFCVHEPEWPMTLFRTISFNLKGTEAIPPPSCQPIRVCVRFKCFSRKTIPYFFWTSLISNDIWERRKRSSPVARSVCGGPVLRLPHASGFQSGDGVEAPRTFPMEQEIWKRHTHIRYRKCGAWIFIKTNKSGTRTLQVRLAHTRPAARWPFMCGPKNIITNLYL